MPSTSKLTALRRKVKAHSAQEREHALSFARSLTHLLPASYMDYLYALSRESGASIDICHLVIAELEAEGTMRWNPHRARLLAGERS